MSSSHSQYVDLFRKSIGYNDFGVQSSGSVASVPNAFSSRRYASAMALASDVLVVGDPGSMLCLNSTIVKGDALGIDAQLGGAPLACFDTGAVHIVRVPGLVGSPLLKALLFPPLHAVGGSALPQSTLLAEFGASVALSADGSTLAVGAPRYPYCPVAEQHCEEYKSSKKSFFNFLKLNLILHK